MQKQHYYDLNPHCFQQIRVGPKFLLTNLTKGLDLVIRFIDFYYCVLLHKFPSLLLLSFFDFERRKLAYLSKVLTNFFPSLLIRELVVSLSYFELIVRMAFRVRLCESKLEGKTFSSHARITLRVSFCSHGSSRLVLTSS